MLSVANEAFLSVIFGDEWINAHITSFSQDPCNIKTDKEKRICWAGGHAKNKLRKFREGENQYFTISLFKPQPDGYAVRRKNNFDACFVIVADDVNEKLPVERAEELPVPTYKLLTSAESEQWGWVLSNPCENRIQVENLLDGLVSRGLAPNGTDPGMKGVTRYVRLPGGYNTKESRLIDGKPFKCQLLSWEPDNLYSMDALASVFDIDINAPREDYGSDKAVLNSDIVRSHPVLKHMRVLHIGNDNWINIECPNHAQHSTGDKTGAAVQVQSDGRLHFQCHHGHCNGDKGTKLTGPRIVKLLDEQLFEGEGLLVDEYYQYVEQITASNKVKLAKVLKMQVQEEEKESQPLYDMNIFDPERYIFIRSRNEFYDIKTGSNISVAALNNSYLSQCPGTKGNPKASNIIFKGMNKELSEAETIGWYPTGPDAPEREDIIFNIGYQKTVNTWRGFERKPNEGNVSLWLEHAEYLIPDNRQREVVLDFLACIVQRVSEKPAFVIGHRGSHRVGKDLFYKPLMKAMGLSCAREVNIDCILNGWGDYIKGLKFCVITEVDKAQDKKVANSMKTVVAPTASGYTTLNLKGQGVIEQKDCMAAIMMSNKRHFIAIEKGDERYFIVDSWVEKRSKDYYKNLDNFVKKGGSEVVLEYLLRRDISHFNHNQLPYMTKGAYDMVQKGKYDYEQDLEEIINEKTPPFHNPWVTTADLRKLVKTEGLKCGNNGLEEALRVLGWFKFTAIKKIGGEVKRIPTFYTNALPENAQPSEILSFWGSKK